MCRLVGVVAAELTEFRLVLKQAPRSLARLSAEHPDGWGVAAHGCDDSVPPSQHEGTRHEGGWRIQKGTERAAECRRFQSVASRSAGTVLIAHVRHKTVGPTSIANTHPFMQSGWVFAHNGTIRDQAFVRDGTSAARHAEVRGETDSEMLFAYLLTRLDRAGITSMRSLLGPARTKAREEATRLLAATTAELRSRDVGALNFLLSDGDSCFVHRFGRTLFLLERRADDPPRSSHASVGTGPTPGTRRRDAVLVASEQLTDEPWRELPEGTLLRVDRDPSPTIALP